MNTEFNIGDRVRSFDFDNHDTRGPYACYVEGFVVGYKWHEDCERCVIHVLRDVFGGEERMKRVGMTVVPPVNGTPKYGDEVCNYIERVKLTQPADRGYNPLNA